VRLAGLLHAQLSDTRCPYPSIAAQLPPLLGHTALAFEYTTLIVRSASSCLLFLLRCPVIQLLLAASAARFSPLHVRKKIHVSFMFT
jgi:hypothetical protein